MRSVWRPRSIPAIDHTHPVLTCLRWTIRLLLLRQVQPRPVLRLSARPRNAFESVHHEPVHGDPRIAPPVVVVDVHLDRDVSQIGQARTDRRRPSRLFRVWRELSIGALESGVLGLSTLAVGHRGLEQNAQKLGKARVALDAAQFERRDRGCAPGRGRDFDVTLCRQHIRLGGKGSRKRV